MLGRDCDGRTPKLQCLVLMKSGRQKIALPLSHIRSWEQRKQCDQGLLTSKHEVARSAVVGDQISCGRPGHNGLSKSPLQARWFPPESHVVTLSAKSPDGPSRKPNPPATDVLSTNALARKPTRTLVQPVANAIHQPRHPSPVPTLNMPLPEQWLRPVVLAKVAHNLPGTAEDKEEPST